MNSAVKKVVLGNPIEKLLKNNMLLPVDNIAIKDSLARLESLRQLYIKAPQAGKNVLKLPVIKKK